MGVMLVVWTGCAIAMLGSEKPTDMLVGVWFVGLIVSFLPGHLLAAHRRGLARLARERRRRAGPGWTRTGLDADGVRLVGAATPGELPPAISSPACRTQRPSS